MKIAAIDTAHGVAIWGRILVVIWRGSPTRDAVAGMNQLALEMIQADESPVCCMIIVEPSSQPPDDKARKEFARFSRDIVSRMSLAVIVTEGGGFRAALVRGVGVTLTTMLPHKIPFKWFNDVSAGALALQSYMPPRSGSSRALVRVVEELKAKIADQATPASTAR
ncbi:MAG TPA: hypothetical protein VHC69_25830 [Polyangiaceae bacterium]|nr:hypothetical protein [Polyangiaceae bacterium]